jgi:SAM-dependent methyltransferase
MYAGPAPPVTRRRPVPDRVIVEQDAATGPRLKIFSRAANVEYWTELWANQRHVSYRREMHGHLPHQLRDTFGRWVRPGSRTLEAGCGLGHFTIAASALGFGAEGLDWSASTVDRLRERFPKIPWHVGDVRRLEFRDESFDAVYSPGVCEHFEDGPVSVLAETHRVLRTGGVAVVSTPCFNGWLQSRATMFDWGQAPPDAAFYEYAFTPHGLARLLTELGFEVLQIRPYASLDTLIRYGGWQVPRSVTWALAFSMDYTPVVRDWGSTCIWVARKR